MPDAIKPATGAGARGISLRDVSFRYPCGNGSGPRCALSDLTLDIEPGQLAAVETAGDPRSESGLGSGAHRVDGS